MDRQEAHSYAIVPSLNIIAKTKKTKLTCGILPRTELMFVFFFSFPFCCSTKVVHFF